MSQSLPSAHVAAHVAALSLQSKAQLQPSHASAQPAVAEHSLAQQPEVQLLQLPSGQSAAHVQLFSPAAAQHVPLPQSCAPQSALHVHGFSPAAAQQL